MGGGGGGGGGVGGGGEGVGWGWVGRGLGGGGWGVGGGRVGGWWAGGWGGSSKDRHIYPRLMHGNFLELYNPCTSPKLMIRKKSSVFPFTFVV